MKTKNHYPDLLKTKQDLKQFKHWLKSLRSNKYEQTTGTLQDDNGFCCLGVACMEFIPKEYRELDHEQANLHGDMPDDQPHAPDWLRNIDEHFGEVTQNYHDSQRFCIPQLNDDLDMSFEEIADTLEAIYLYGVLED